MNSTQDITEQLNKMKRAIDEAEKQVNQLQGRLDALYEQMKKEFGITSLSDAEAELQRMDAELAQKEAKLAQDVKQLLESYDWKV